MGIKILICLTNMIKCRLKELPVKTLKILENGGPVCLRQDLVQTLNSKGKDTAGPRCSQLSTQTARGMQAREEGEHGGDARNIYLGLFAKDIMYWIQKQNPIENPSGNEKLPTLLCRGV